MRKYQYLAYNFQGQEIKGEIEAQDPVHADLLLSSQGLTPAQIYQEKIKLARVGNAKQATYTLMKQLQNLLSAGVELDKAVQILKQANRTSELAHKVQAISAALQSGDSLLEALKKAELKLPHYTYSVIEAGEQSGLIAPALEDVINYLEYQDKLRASAVSSLIYPCILIIFGIASTLFIFAFVVPKFANLLQHADQLPYLSYLVLSLGQSFNQNQVEILLAIAAIIAVIMTLNQSEKGRAWVFTHLLAKIPIIRRQAYLMQVAQWSGLLAILLKNRVAMLKSLSLASQTIFLQDIAIKLDRCRKSVEAGQMLSNALREVSVLPEEAIGLIEAGDRAGKLDDMLKSVQALYDNKSKENMQRFLSLIEPIAILLIGGLIGTVMIGIVLAITASSDFVV